MATTYIKVNIIDVGQGQCTFVEVYTDPNPNSNTDAPTHTLMFDCGSDAHSPQNNKNLYYIEQILSLMDFPAIDCLVFSHSDSDHISLINTLINKHPNLPIKTVWYGGNYEQYAKNNTNILETLVENGFCNSDDIGGLYANHSFRDNGDDESVNYLWRSEDGEVELYPIVANVLIAKPDFKSSLYLDVPVLKTSESLNRASIICGLKFSNSTYVICGDATNVTMGAFNTLFSGPTIDPLFTNIVMTTIPHHGSRTTGLRSNCSQGVRYRAAGIVNRFVCLLQSRTYTVSSFQQHNHPSLQLLSYFKPSCPNPCIRDNRLLESNSHLLVLNEDLNSGSYHNAITSNNIFGTDYFINTLVLPIIFNAYSDFPNYIYKNDIQKIDPLTQQPYPINSRACWVYTTNNNDITKIEGRVDMSLPSFTEDLTNGSLIVDEPPQITKKVTRKKLSIISKRHFSGQLKSYSRYT